MPTVSPAPGRRGVLSYVRRSPRMTPSQAAWLARFADQWVIPVRTGELGTTVSPGLPVDLPTVFGRVAPLIVEIGSGHGDALVAAASTHPDVDFLGFEVFDASIAATLGKIDAAGVTNVRLIAADAVTGLTHLILPRSVQEIWVFFPDPWPKKRHHKRRLVSGAFADLASRTLIDDGVIRLATDSQSYAEHIEAILGADPRFELTSTQRFDTRPLTKFEKRGLEAGRAIHDFTYHVTGRES